MTAYCELTPALLFSQLELELIKEEAQKIIYHSKSI